MNIYITSANEHKLRQYVKERPQATMSGLINALLVYHFDKLESGITPSYNSGTTIVPDGKVVVSDTEINENSHE